MGDHTDASGPEGRAWDAVPGDGPLWVFAYGSLLWNPGFEPVERRPASLRDFHRSFSMRSIHHRGTEERPGLVLALDFEAGATCRGLALRAPPGEEAAVLAALRDRELVSSAYLERAVTLETRDGPLTALAYVMSREHPQYAGGLPLDVQARIIARSRGGRGPNDDYLYSTVHALSELGIEDPDLDLLAELVRTLSGSRPRGLEGSRDPDDGAGRVP